MNYHSQLLVIASAAEGKALLTSFLCCARKLGTCILAIIFSSTMYEYENRYQWTFYHTLWWNNLLHTARKKM